MKVRWKAGPEVKWASEPMTFTDSCSDFEIDTDKAGEQLRRMLERFERERKDRRLDRKLPPYRHEFRLSKCSKCGVFHQTNEACP